MKLLPVIILAAGIALSAGVLLYCLPERADPIPAGSETERQLWLFGQGYKGREVSAQEIIVPAPEDPVFSDYAAMQTEQGFAPERYAGHSAVRYVYALEQTDLYAELLVSDGVLIGAMCCDPAEHTMRRMNGKPYP
jgi:hypothetical protein